MDTAEFEELAESKSTDIQRRTMRTVESLPLTVHFGDGRGDRGENGSEPWAAKIATALHGSKKS